ncbi:hypothetical protein D3C71_1542390 [compost metagenome]
MLGLRGGQGAEQEVFGLSQAVVLGNAGAEYFGEIGMNRRGVVDNEDAAIDLRRPDIH